VSKLLVATSFGVTPARGGGQARVLGLYSSLARRGVAVDVVALVESGERAEIRPLAPGLREIRVPRTAAHTQADWELQMQSGVPMEDLGLALNHALTPAYGAALERSADDADAVVASHPFAHPALAAATDAPLVYEAHNVELDLKAEMYGSASDLVEAVRAVEGECARAAEHVIVCAERDADRLQALYGIDRNAAAVVPNGADPARVPFTPPAERRRRQEALAVDARLALFIGSWHEPNLVALRDLLRLAPGIEDVRFVIVGSVGLAVAGEPMPVNVDLCGVADDGFLRSALAVADVALNPMTQGSGSNLKMLDYALAGLPVISTAFGARGLDLEPGRHYIEAEVEALPAALAGLGGEAPETTAARVAAFRDHAQRRFSWDAIADGWANDPGFQGLLDKVDTR
jgi:glycosyltransferase involved in cell wall biosynthesis